MVEWQHRRNGLYLCVGEQRTSRCEVADLCRQIDVEVDLVVLCANHQSHRPEGNGYRQQPECAAFGSSRSSNGFLPSTAPQQSSRSEGSVTET